MLKNQLIVVLWYLYKLTKFLLLTGRGQLCLLYILYVLIQNKATRPYALLLIRLLSKMIYNVGTEILKVTGVQDEINKFIEYVNGYFVGIIEGTITTSVTALFGTSIKELIMTLISNQELIMRNQELLLNNVGTLTTSTIATTTSTATAETMRVLTNAIANAGINYATNMVTEVLFGVPIPSLTNSGGGRKTRKTRKTKKI
jgi:hypothetical protein